MWQIEKSVFAAIRERWFAGEEIFTNILKQDLKKFVRREES
ncbi:hypothetical protein SDC9_148713 [bioreactor metagenome]|uniref:Uncharacterized protein n=1 Tax=bioreactor metagenome TaxID=1076179 RepID=A0A645ELE8_9ZZZZ